MGTAVDFSDTDAEKQACALSSTELAHIREAKAISWRLPESLWGKWLLEPDREERQHGRSWGEGGNIPG